jgi:hypothetical protein
MHAIHFSNSLWAFLLQRIGREQTNQNRTKLRGSRWKERLLVMAGFLVQLNQSNYNDVTFT